LLIWVSTCLEDLSSTLKAVNIRPVRPNPFFSLKEFIFYSREVREKGEKLIKKVSEVNELTPTLSCAIKNATSLEEIEILAAPVSLLLILLSLSISPFCQLDVLSVGIVMFYSIRTNCLGQFYILNYSFYSFTASGKLFLQFFSIRSFVFQFFVLDYRF
jgi:hypothetical protein